MEYAEAAYTPDFISERCVGEAGWHEPLSIFAAKRAKRTMLASYLKAMWGKPEGTSWGG